MVALIKIFLCLEHYHLACVRCTESLKCSYWYDYIYILFSGAVISMFYSAVSILKSLKKFAFFSFWSMKNSEWAKWLSEEVFALQTSPPDRITNFWKVPLTAVCIVGTCNNNNNNFKRKRKSSWSSTNSGVYSCLMNNGIKYCLLLKTTVYQALWK